jgi:hypothetical protein
LTIHKISREVGIVVGDPGEIDRTISRRRTAGTLRDRWSVEKMFRITTMTGAMRYARHGVAADERRRTLRAV